MSRTYNRPVYYWPVENRPTWGRFPTGQRGAGFQPADSRLVGCEPDLQLTRSTTGRLETGPTGVVKQLRRREMRL